MFQTAQNISKKGKWLNDTHGMAPIIFLKITCAYTSGSAGQESACSVENLGSIPASGRSPGERKGYLPQYPGLENSMDCIVHVVTESQTQLSDFHFKLSQM